MSLIRELFGVSSESRPNSAAQRPASQIRYMSGPRVGAPGSVHKVAPSTSPNDAEPSSIPDDPDTTPRSSGRIQHL